MASPLLRLAALAAAAALTLAGCSGGGKAGGAGDDGPGGGGGGGNDGADGGAGDGDSGDPSDAWNTFLRGQVRVQLYETDRNGDIQFLNWPIEYGDAFPFGQIFVGSIRASLPTDGGLFTAGTAVAEPVIEGNDFFLGMELDQTEQLLVYGALDYWDNNIVHTSDPIGSHPVELTVRPGDDLDGIDFTILAPFQDFGGLSAADYGVSNQADERTYCEEVEISGTYEVTVDAYQGGNAMAMLFDRDGNGPHDWGEAVLTPTPDGGATGSYRFTTCQDQGFVELRGRWDNNINEFYDPYDMYGAFAVSPGVNGNPIAIATVDLDDMPIESPLDDDADSVALVPFVRMGGTLSVTDGFDSLPSGSSVVVAAAKYRLEGGIDIDELDEKAYGYELFEWPDLTGESQVEWSIVVPSDTLVYLWAYADENADGTLNQSGESVASGGDDDNGRYQTGSANSSHDLVLSRAISR